MSDWRGEPSQTCPNCPHKIGEHSSEPGVGCLNRQNPERFARMPGTVCPCLRPGTSQADQ